MLRRAGLILTTMLLGVIVLSGVALAVTKVCTTNPCEGTSGPDTLIGNASKNLIDGRPGADYIAGLAGLHRLRRWHRHGLRRWLHPK